MTQVGVVGGAGRMGRTICAAVRDAHDLTLAVVVDPHAVGQTIDGSVVIASLDEYTGPKLDVVVDFTVADVARATIAWCIDNRVHAVVGTTGLGALDFDKIRDAINMPGSSHVLVAPNFAIGAVLLMRTAEQLAKFFDTAEIIELHHDAKLDAPSGTAVATVDRIDRARIDAGITSTDPTMREAEGLEGARGALSSTGVGVHSVRARGIIASEEVVFGTVGQVLTLRHDTFDRTSFVPGVLLAVRNIAARPGLSLSLEDYL
jgi:4-hydroxy-tetrahydrodipicolinate reductase